MGPVEEQEAIAEAASVLAGSLPAGWKTAEFYVMFLGGFSIAEMEVENENGEVVSAQIPASINLNTMNLRSGMYKANEGTWFTWKLALWSEGRFKSSFDYDNRPPFTFEPGLNDYRKERKLFPRGVEFTPGWLQEKFDEIDRKLQGDAGPEDG